MRHFHAVVLLTIGVIFCLAPACLAKDRYYVSVGFSGKWINSTDHRTPGDFHVSDDHFSGIQMVETDTGFRLHPVRSDPWGYSIDPALFAAFSISLGWRYSDHFVSTLSYERHFNRRGRQQLPWSGSPDGPFPDWSATLTYESKLVLHDFQLFFEYYPGWRGLFFIVGREISLEQITETTEWNVYKGDSLDNVSRNRKEDTNMSQFIFLGAGWSVPLAKDTQLVFTSTYSFSTPFSGLKLRAGIRRYVL